MEPFPDPEDWTLREALIAVAVSGSIFLLGAAVVALAFAVFV